MAIPKSGDQPENMNIQQNPETGKYRIEGRSDLGETDSAEELQSKLQQQPDKPGTPSKQSSTQKPSAGKQQPTKTTQPPPPPPSSADQSPQQDGNGNPQSSGTQPTSLPDIDENAVPENPSEEQVPDDEHDAPETEENTPQEVEPQTAEPQQAVTPTQEEEEEGDEEDPEQQQPEQQGQEQPVTPQAGTPQGDDKEQNQEEEGDAQKPESQQQSPQSGTPQNKNSQQNPKQPASPASQPKSDNTDKNNQKPGKDSEPRKASANQGKSVGKPTTSLKDAAKNKAKETAVNAAKDTKAGEAAEKAVEVADKTTKTVGAIKTGFLKVKAMIPILANPYFWVAVLVLLVLLATMLFVMATPQVIGRDDNRRVCLDENSINNQIGTMSAADARGRAQEIGDYLTSTHFDPLGGPMTVTQAGAFVGNLMVETGGTLNPSIKQGGDTSEMSNSEVRSWSGGQSGRALGIVQWDSGRALQLIDFAESRNANWDDLELQIEFFTHELNGSEGGGVRNALPQLESSDIETVTLAWDRSFWRSAGYHGQERVGHAVEFMEYYEQGAHAGTHGVTICNDHDLVSMDASNIVDLAISIAHTSGRIEDSHVPSFGFDIFGDAVAPEAYKEANALAFENGGADPYAGGKPVYASCDRFVATVLKASKTDVDVPWGSTGTQIDHYKASDKWEHVTTVTTGEDPVAKGAEAGDVLIRVGHTALYLGTPENASEIGLSPGVPAVADASIMRRVGFVRPFAYMDSPSQRYEVFRCVNDCGDDTLEGVA